VRSTHQPANPWQGGAARAGCGDERRKIGVNRLVRVDFDLTKSLVTFLRQALDGIRDRLNQWGGYRIPAFGKPVGVIINYSPYQAIQFDLTGKPIAIFDKAYRLGRARFSIGGYLRPTMVLGSDTDDAGSFL
jgi:hypothetical protein